MNKYSKPDFFKKSLWHIPVLKAPAGTREKELRFETPLASKGNGFRKSSRPEFKHAADAGDFSCAENLSGPI